MAKSCDYYLTDSVFIEYDTGGEITATLRIDRSKVPRWVRELAPGQTVVEWIEEHEDLITRIIYEGGAWTVKSWEQLYYTEEISDLKIDFSSVLNIKRSVWYKVH